MICRNSMSETSSPIPEDNQMTRRVIKELFAIRKRPGMFMREPSYMVLYYFLHGIAFGIHDWKDTEEYEIVCWSEMEQDINELMLPKVNSKQYSDEELFYIFFDILEKVIIENYKQYTDLIVY